MKKEKYNVVVAGATGAVGNEMVATLEQRDFPVDQLKLLASTRGAGTPAEAAAAPRPAPRAAASSATAPGDKASP